MKNSFDLSFFFLFYIGVKRILVFDMQKLFKCSTKSSSTLFDQMKHFISLNDGITVEGITRELGILEALKVMQL